MGNNYQIAYEILKNAVISAEECFRDYAAMHLARGKTEKAKNNEIKADTLAATLKQAEIVAQRETQAEGAVHIAMAQVAADKLCEIMDENGHACNSESECWKQSGGGCKDCRSVYQVVLEAGRK